MMASFLRTRTLSAAGALDRRLHTSPRGPTDTFSGPERAKPARNSFHCCKLLSAVRLRVVLTVLDHTHVQLLQNTTHIHAHRTYRHDQGSLLNTYFLVCADPGPATPPTALRASLLSPHAAVLDPISLAVVAP
jgi:hypothetical protein